MLRRVERYGIDAPLMVFCYLGIGIAALIFAFFSDNGSGRLWNIIWGFFFLLGGIVSLHTSLYGKSNIWDSIITGLKINPNASILDLGTGHGLVLIKLAHKLGVQGQAIGIDSWNKQDQLNNSAKKLFQNIKAANLKCSNRIDTGDIRNLPYENNAFDTVTSSFVFHNIKEKNQRLQAFKEADRVLKSKGTFVIVDTEHKAKEYIDVLITLGFSVQVQKSGFDGWWTGPWMSSSIIIAIKA